MTIFDDKCNMKRGDTKKYRLDIKQLFCVERTRLRRVEICLDDVKTEDWPILRDKLGGCLRLPKWHPACRRREPRPGSCMERE
jgi:hypothetical protein